MSSRIRPRPCRSTRAEVIKSHPSPLHPAKVIFGHPSDPIPSSDGDSDHLAIPVPTWSPPFPRDTRPMAVTTRTITFIIDVAS